jgi:hypothetical protein
MMQPLKSGGNEFSLTDERRWITPEEVGDPRQHPDVTIWTSRYANRNLAHLPVSPIVASIGYPRFRLAYRPTGRAMLLMPTREMLSLDPDRFAEMYLQRLEQAGVDRIRAELREQSDPRLGPPCVLCFEWLFTGPPDRHFCHRRLFAAYWQDKTGEPVLEVDPAAG